MKRYAGYTLIALGLLHVAAGIGPGWPQIKMILDMGVWNALGQQPQNICMQHVSCLQMNTIWWFTSWGLMLILFGSLCTWVERSLERAIPSWIASLLIIISMINAIIIPASGFWLVMVVGIYMLFPRKSQA